MTLSLVTETGKAPVRSARRPKSPKAETLAQVLAAALDDAKAEGIVSLDLHGKTSIADTMLIATGRSNVHVGAIAHRVVEACKGMLSTSPRVEGMPHNDWVLIDAGDAIVHIFRPEVRQFYNLEKLWSGDRPSEPEQV